MKKMIVVAATLMVAVMSQAITVQWGSNGATNIDGNTLNATTRIGTAYVIALAGPSVSGSMIDALYDQWKNGGPVVSVNTTGANSNFLGVMGSTAIIADGAAIPNSSLVLTEGVTYFTSVFFITYGGNDYYYLGNSILYDKGSSAWNGVSQILDVRGATPPNATWTLYVPVPEPTAMALLALGAAALGLRRRFRK